MEKINVGIIGAGRIGQVHAKSITYHIPQAEIVAISDIYVKVQKRLQKNSVFLIIMKIIMKF